MPIFRPGSGPSKGLPSASGAFPPAAPAAYVPSALASTIRFNPTASGLSDWTFQSIVQGYNSPALGGAVHGLNYSVRAETTDLSQWEETQCVYISDSFGGTFYRTKVMFNSSGTGVGRGQSGAGAKINFTSVPQVAVVALAEDLAPTVIGWSTGDAKLTFKTTADPGWILCDDGSIGNAVSGATTRANSDTMSLFAVLYNAVPALVVQDSTGATVSRGANAAVDYAANRRLVIPKTLGRAIAIAGSGSGLTARTLGGTAGAETETPTAAKTAAHTHDVTIADFAQGTQGAGGGRIVQFAGITTSSSVGSGTALNIVPPESFLNIMIML